jgi:hypothetical protein
MRVCRRSSHSAARRSRRVSRGRPWPRSGRRRWAGPEGCRPGAGAGPRRSGCGWHSSRIRPSLPGRSVSRSRGSGRIPPGQSPRSVRRRSHRGGGAQDRADASHQAGGRAQPVAAAGLPGQAGDEAAQAGTGRAEPFCLAGAAGYGLHRGEGDQSGIAQAGRHAARRAATAPGRDAPSACRRPSPRVLSRGCPRRSSQNDPGHPRSRLRGHPLDHTTRRNQCHTRNCSPPRRSSPTRRSC